MYLCQNNTFLLSKKQGTVQSAVNKNVENETRDASACQQFLKCSLRLYFQSWGKESRHELSHQFVEPRSLKLFRVEFF